METAQGTDLKNLVDEIKDLLEQNYTKKLRELGIRQDDSELVSLSELVDYQLLESEEEREKFANLRENIHNFIEIEEKAIEGTWSEAHYWVLDRIVYSFFNRLFSIRVMEELELLNESTLKPQADLGNRSARMAKIQERFYDLSETQWYKLLLEDAFDELTNEIKVIFDKNDPLLQLWPDGEVIERINEKLNALDPEIYRQDDVLGWFYHYYVVKFRKGHKTMSAHGGKAPANAYYLSVLNTVYTPLWMVRTLVDNSFGHWWLEHNPDSRIFEKSPYLIEKLPTKVGTFEKQLEELKILDPACGSGNFLLYAFRVLVECYREKYSDRSITEIISRIIGNNIYGVDINRRPAQLAALGLYILAKRMIKEQAPEKMPSFIMPPVNIVSCDIRLPRSEFRTLFLQKVPENLKKIAKEILDLFDNADQLGSLIDIQSIQKEIVKVQKTGLNRFILEKNQLFNLVETIDEILQSKNQSLGFQIFGQQTKSAISLASVLSNNYDFVYGNPPFGLVIKNTQQKLKKYYPNSYSDLVSAFVDQSLRLMNPKAYIGMVTDYSFLHLPKFEKFRRKVVLAKTNIQIMIMLCFRALPDAGNRPILFILRKEYFNDFKSLCRIEENIEKNRDIRPEVAKDIGIWNERISN
ncbi:MAG: Eco57I restriction-modification methylase domain-containing protein, partial [Candidatus Odinarchaeota archaeon]